VAANPQPENMLSGRDAIHRTRDACDEERVNIKLTGICLQDCTPGRKVEEARTYDSGPSEIREDASMLFAVSPILTLQHQCINAAFDPILFDPRFISQNSH